MEDITLTAKKRTTLYMVVNNLTVIWVCIGVS